jgi:PEP-CTERM motif
MRSRLVCFANREVPFTFLPSHRLERVMKCCIMSALLVGLLAAPASAQLLFGYENGEVGMPYVGNPAGYVTTLSNVGVTQGVQSLQTTAPIPAFGGPGSAAFTDAGRANIINNSPYVLIDMTVPQKAFGFGNIDLQFFQTGMRGGAGFDETGYSPTFAASSGSTITLQIPLTGTQFGSSHIALDPSQPWSYQIDLSFNSAAGGPYTFQFDNLRAVPEPASLGLFAIGLVAAGFARRRGR